MKKVTEENLEKICGGSTFTGTVVRAFTEIIKILYDAGHSVGSSVRRVSEGSICPLE